MARTPNYRLAVVVWSPAGEEFVVVRQTPPPPLEGEEYAGFVDSDLWDLPTVPLGPLSGEAKQLPIDGVDAVAGKFDISSLDISAALEQILTQSAIPTSVTSKWMVLKYVEEADFGPGAPTDTLYLCTSLESKQENLEASCMWISKEEASKLLLNVQGHTGRVGPHVFAGLFSHTAMPSNLASMFRFQDYPPALTIVPMESGTLPPFRTTNLVMVKADKDISGLICSKPCICGDALIVDPGCSSHLFAELSDIVSHLPKKLLVFVTHHHPDHIKGLSTVQKCNPDAILLVHENTMNRIGKEHWSNSYTSVSGGEKICIGDQQLEVVYAPGHTDGHLALLHINSSSLIVGDHCVGEGSAVLDTRSGGSMKDYFDTSYMFLDLSPHCVIPMHGRTNLWPKRMLCGYLKHRRDREVSILRTITGGANSLYDIVAKTYSETNKTLWFLASLNVKLHVEHLDLQGKLPEGFSMEVFKRSFDEFDVKLKDIKQYGSGAAPASNLVVPASK